TNMSYRRYLDLQQMTHSFADFAAFFPPKAIVGTGDAAREMRILAASASFFDFYSARPVIGRFFNASEDKSPDGGSVAVLANKYWRVQYGGRTDVLVKTVQVAGRIYTIIGVAPLGFSGASTSTESALAPLPFSSPQS